MGVHFIQLTNQLHRAEGTIEEDIVVCVEHIQWYKDNRLKMINDEVYVKEDKNEIWRKIYQVSAKHR